MVRQKKIVAAAQKARIGEDMDVLIDGPSPSRLVLKGRLEGQAPDIDPVVVLTDCDPERVTQGSHPDGIVGARGYDCGNPRETGNGELVNW